MGEFSQEIEVARDEVIFRDDTNRVSEIAKYLQATPGESEVAFDRLVTVRDTAHGDGLRFPFAGREFGAQEGGRVLLDHDFTLEIESGRETEVFMGWPGVAVDTAVLTIKLLSLRIRS